MSRDFRSDNIAPPSQAIIDNVLTRSKAGHDPYGTDTIGTLLTDKIEMLFEHPVDVFPVLTGTAANALVLSHVARTFGTVLCHEQSHVFLDECGAVEFHGRGLRLTPIPGHQAKMSVDALARGLDAKDDVHQLRAGALSISQSTEAGTVYRSGELTSMSALAKRTGLPVHMDGTRLANALVFAGCAPAELTWKCGIDVLCLGATKGGAPGAEAVVFFNHDLAKDFWRALKRSGHLPSRLWLLSAQLEAYLSNDHWLNCAGHANRMANRLASALGTDSTIKCAYPVETNMVFLAAEQTFWESVRARGYLFHTTEMGDASCARFVMSYATDPDDVDRLADTLLELAREYVARDGGSAGWHRMPAA
jgi:threonine aldolase